MSNEFLPPTDTFVRRHVGPDAGGEREMLAASAKDGLGPATTDELKKWLTADEKRLTDLGLSRADVDGIFISPRDGQPYEIQPKRQPNPFVTGGGAPTVTWTATYLSAAVLMLSSMETMPSWRRARAPTKQPPAV